MISAKQRSSGIALVITLLVIVVLTISVTAFMQSMSLERRTSSAYLNITRAQSSAESGLESATRKILTQMTQTASGGAAYTTWAYYADPLTSSYYSAMTVGHPPDLNPTSPWLSPANTVWLFSDSNTFSDPNNLNNATALVANPDTILTSSYANINMQQRFKDLPAVVNAPWQEVKRIKNSTNIEMYRFAYWVDDESSRINTKLAGNIKGAGGAHLHDLGVRPDEIQPFNISGPELSDLVSLRGLLFTPESFRQAAPTTAPSSAYGFLTTSFSAGMDVIQYAPDGSATALPDYPYRGMNKMNLNYMGHTDSTVSVDFRVNRLSNWIERGAPKYFTDGVSKYPDAAGTTLSPAIRRDMVKTVAASMIDYIDTDMYPTQPPTLPVPSDITNPPPPVQLMSTVPRPTYFGVDSCPQINEVQIIYNSSGASDSYAAKPTVTRTGSAGSYTWSIPITRRFELWNMTDKTIPATHYNMRMYNQEVIRAGAFGFGADSIPDSTEEVLDLGTLTFAPNEIKAVDVTKTYTSTGTNSLSTNFDQFVKGPDGQTGSSSTNNDDEPNGVDKRACVLFTTGSSAWLSATTYLQGNTFATSTPKGNVSTGIGNRGASQGNRINDPRLSTLRFYTDGVNASTSSSDFERDAGSNRPGTTGTTATINVPSLNNGPVSSGSFDYQNLDFWYDRPQMKTSLPKNAEAVSTIANARFRSVGEMGNIFDPSWVHPRGRGADSNDGSGANYYGYRTGIKSLFRGGANLRIGSPDGLTRYYVPTGTPPSLISWDSNSWILMDLFSTSFDTTTDNQLLLPPEWTGKVNINFPKSVTVNTNVFTNLDLLFRLQSLSYIPPSNLGTNFLTAPLYSAIRDKRLSKTGTDGVGGAIDGWTKARPFFSTGEVSELPIWLDKNLYLPAETDSKTPTGGSPTASQQLTRVNRSDRARKEIFNRSANLITTNSGSFRVYIVGQYCQIPVSDPTKIKVMATQQMEVSMRYKPSFNATTGALESVMTKQIYRIQP